MNEEGAKTVCRELKLKYPVRFRGITATEETMWVKGVLEELGNIDADVAVWAVRNLQEKYCPEIRKLKEELHFVQFDAQFKLKQHWQAERDPYQWFYRLKPQDKEFFERCVNQL